MGEKERREAEPKKEKQRLKAQSYRLLITYRKLSLESQRPDITPSTYDPDLSCWVLSGGFKAAFRPVVVVFLLFFNVVPGQKVNTRKKHLRALHTERCLRELLST